MMRSVIALLLLGSTVSLVGCGESKPDPSTRPGFVDTSDPTKLKMPPLPAPGGAPAPQPGAAQPPK